MALISIVPQHASKKSDSLQQERIFLWFMNFQVALVQRLLAPSVLQCSSRVLDSHVIFNRSTFLSCFSFSKAIVYWSLWSYKFVCLGAFDGKWVHQQIPQAEAVELLRKHHPNACISTLFHGYYWTGWVHKINELLIFVVCSLVLSYPLLNHSNFEYI